MKQLLSLSGFKKKDLLTILNTADQMKFSLIHRLEKKPLNGRTLALFFPVPSSGYARLSFETAMYQLGGHAVLFQPEGSSSAPLSDTARMLSRYNDGIVFSGLSKQDMEAFAEHSSVPVINASSDYADPCRILAYFMTIRERFSVFDNIKICYIGPPGGVFNSLAAGAAAFGMEVSAAVPEGCSPLPPVLRLAGKRLSLTHDPREAVKNASIICLDAGGGMPGGGFIADAGLVALASPDAMLFTGCRSGAITDEIFEKHSKDIFNAAENLLHVHKAVLTVLMDSDEE